VLAGDVSAADARRAFAGLLPRRSPLRPPRRPARAAPRPASPAATAAAPARPRVVLRDRPGAVDVQLRLAATGVGPGSRDHAAMLVTSQLLGGELGRLDRLLRLEKGWALSVRAQTAVGPGRWTLEATLPAAQITPGLREMLRAIALVASGGVTEAEVARARSTLARRLQVEQGSPLALAQALASQAAAGAGSIDLAAGPRALAAVGPAEVTRIARSYLAPERATLVVTGDRRRVEPALEALGLEPARAPDAPAPQAASAAMR
jgi:zinc protease